MPEMIFQQTAARVAIAFSSYVKIFENTAFGHVTKVPSLVVRLYNNVAGRVFFSGPGNVRMDNNAK